MVVCAAVEAAAAAGKRIAVALSGGVDSTVTALLLKEKGYDLIGVYMRNWDEKDENGFCRGDDEWNRVEGIARRLDIECVQVNFVKEYWNKVFTSLLDGYSAGLTPNPDVVCNREIKFAALMEHCEHHLGAGCLATGHYARLRPHPDGGGEVQLLRAVDASRDQTYFLAEVCQLAFRRSSFPLGGMLKSDVFELARRAGFHDIAAQPESRGLCFIGKRKFASFLDGYIERRPGPVVTSSGLVVGEHDGVHSVTRGQRVPLPRAARTASAVKSAQLTSYHVYRRDAATNTVFVVPGSEHLALYNSEFTTGPAHWINGLPEALAREDGVLSGLGLEPRFGPRMQERRVALRRLNGDPGGGLRLVSDRAMRAVSPGQVGVFYDGDVCLGSAPFKTFEPLEGADTLL